MNQGIAAGVVKQRDSLVTLWSQTQNFEPAATFVE